MTDRNDRLLLALGWTLTSDEQKNLGMANILNHPDGRAFDYEDAPLPYDNLQDAVDCVPEGWEVQLKWRSGGDYGHAVLHNPDTNAMHYAMQDTAAEALSEAILKAVEKSDE